MNDIKDKDFNEQLILNFKEKLIKNITKDFCDLIYDFMFKNDCYDSEVGDVFIYCSVLSNFLDKIQEKNNISVTNTYRVFTIKGNYEFDNIEELFKFVNKLSEEHKEFEIQRC